jgi:hypothetical protein
LNIEQYIATFPPFFCYAKLVILWDGLPGLIRSNAVWDFVRQEP